ncbi:hypothetical protein [uncultured Slackia sp.]|uniref:hypothetical protein n=1 Tax=uncultured Slackia sp. TaxID=665903 RepID=UPI000D79E68C|nr:hypothetical protein [uncultured Slackia sp.]PWM49324.1 MAG: hypothetical protein DBX56_02610 [Coriobacteriia bacterium]
MENTEKSGRDWSDVVNDLDTLGLEIREMGSVAFLMIETRGLDTPEQDALSLASRRLEELSKRQDKLTKELSQMMSDKEAGAA